jgi:hypothetical protein
MNDFQGVIHSMIEQGPGYSPDGGNLWRQGNLIYWQDGDVVNLEERDSYIIRYMRLTNGEDYSKWTDEQCAKVKAERAEQIAKYKTHAEELTARRDKLVKSAKAKLTTEEFEAVQSLGGDNY